MTTDQAPGRGRWHGEKPQTSAPTRSETLAKKWIGATVLSLLLLGVAAVMVWLSFLFLFPNTPRPTFVPFLISSYQKQQIAPIAEMENERAALQKTQIFPVVDSTEDPNWNSTLEVMKTRLDKLTRLKTGKGVVVYIAAYAMVSGSGDVQILAYDSDPYSPGTLLPLQTVLAQLRASPERHKLLVLDIMKSSPYPFDLGGTPDGVADLIRKELQDQKDSGRLVDPDLLVLVACSSGQVGLWSERLHESIFGHFFRAAFADPRADSLHRNGSISVRELAAYLTDKVDHWAIQYQGTRQQPYLVGEAADFDLALVKPSPDGAQAEPLAKATAEAVGKEAPQQKEPEKTSTEAKGHEVAAKDASQKPEEKSAPESESNQPAYPDWLSKGWELRHAWWKENGNRDFQGAASPRVFRRLEASLLRAERQWRGGHDPEEIGRNLSTTVKDLQHSMEVNSKVPRPQTIRSAGQAKAFGWQAQSALVSKLKNLVETQRTIKAASDPKSAEAAQKKGVDELIAAAKTSPDPDVELAGTIVEATLDQRLDPGTILFLDGLVTESKVGLNVVELRFLRDLAERARMPGSQDWAEETVKVAWNMIGLAERAGDRPRTFPWVRGILEQVQNARHAVQVMLLSQAREFVSWERIRQLCEPTVKDLEFVTACQDKIEDAQTALNRMRAVLPAYLPYLHATRKPNLDNVWLAAAEAAVVLDRRLQKPPVGDDTTPALSHDELEQLNGDLTAAMGTVNPFFEQLERPFRSDAIKEILERIASRPDPHAAAEIDALLSTPFLKLEDRTALWKSGRLLEQRLSELPVTADRPADDSAADTRRADVARSQVARRGKRLEALLRLTGADAMAANIGGAVELTTQLNALDRAPSKNEATDASALAQNWAGLAKVAAIVHDRLTRLLDQRGKFGAADRVGWVAPPYMLNMASGLTRQSREQDALANWSWLAGCYRHQARDLHEELDPPQFYENAAQDCPETGQPITETDLAISLTGPPIPTLSASLPEATVTVKVDAGATPLDKPQKVRLESLQIDDPRLRVSLQAPSEVELSSQKPDALATIKIEWNEERGRSDTAPPKGFMLQARLANGRTFHSLVPVPFEWRAVFPKLALSSTKEKLTEVPINRFSLRTLPGRQPFYVFLINPSQTTSREVIVDIMAGTEVIASSGAKPLSLPQKSTIPVASFGTPAPKEGLPLTEIPTDLRLRLRNGNPATGPDFDVLRLAPTIALPEEYVEVTLAQFRPAGPNGQNQLKVNLRATPRMTGPPCPVELVFPRDKELFPALQGVPQGKLSGSLEVGKDLTLTADGINLALGGSESGVFQLNIDGLKRAMWFRANFIQVGGTQTAREETTPARVRFTTERIVKPNQPAQLKVSFLVDKAPANATLAFNLGAAVGGVFVSDKQFRDRSPRKRHIGFDPHGDEGALLFEAAIGDWEEIYDVRGIRGARQARAFLLGSGGKPIADSGVVEIVLDDLPPKLLSMELPGVIDEGTPLLDVRCTLTPSASRITDVDFVLGTKAASAADFTKADDEGKMTKATMALDNDQRIWKARIPVPKDASGKLVVTARATSEVGLNDILSQAVTVRGKPAPVPAEEAAAKMAPKPGSIEGTVVEAGVTRGGFTVYLVDPKAKDPEKAVKETKTKDDGSFSFAEIAPGDYILTCQNPETKRVDRPSVTVEAGKVARKKLDLLLP